MPKKLDNFHWYRFGTVVGWGIEGDRLFVNNTQGDKRYISQRAYASSIPNIKEKIDKLRGYKCFLRVSKNTANWSEEEWFSDIQLDRGPGFEAGLPECGDNRQTQPVKELQKELEEEKLKREAAEQERDEARESAKKASDTAEEEKARNNKLSKENAELIKENAELKADRKDAEKGTRQERTKWTEELAEMGLPGKTREILVKKGHAERTLALRVGVINLRKNSKVELRFLEHVRENKYRVALIKHDDVEAIVALGFGARREIFATTFGYSQDFRVWDRAWERAHSGGHVEYRNDNFIKDETDKSLEELAAIHKRVSNFLDSSNGTKSFTTNPISTPPSNFIPRDSGGCEVCGGYGYVSNEWDGPCFVCGRSSPDDEMGYF